jgi:choline dehydrogenase-like flavoprotein
MPAVHRAQTGGRRLVGADEVDDPATAQDIPAFLADLLRDCAERVENATDLTMHPGYGLRAGVDVAEVVRLEFANHMAASGLQVARRHAGFRSGAGGRAWRFALGLPCDLCGG